MKKVICLSLVLLLVIFGGGCASNKTNGLKFTLSRNEDYYIVTGIEDPNSRDVNIPDMYNKLPVREIGAGAFEGCENLSSVTMPEGLLVIGSSAFEDCSSLTEISLPTTLQEIHANAFRDCISLEEIVIPGSVEELASGIFYGCSSLRDVTIEDGVRKIGDYSDITAGVFSGCNIWHIVIPESVNYISRKSFSENPLEYAVFENTSGWKLGVSSDNLLAEPKYIPESDMEISSYAAKVLLQLATSSKYTYMSRK